MNFDKKKITNALQKGGIYIGEFPETLIGDLWEELYKKGVPGVLNAQYQQGHAE